MFTQTLHTETKSLLKKIAGFANKKNYYLAGGTALALQLGHRMSMDLDFFSQKEIDTKKLMQDLRENGFKFQIQNESAGTLDLTIQGVKVSFLEYKYPLIGEFINFEGLKMSSTLDIACMKITAISSRGNKKDFFDIWAILKEHSLSEIFDALRKKYEGADYNTTHLLKSLTYFEDAENDPEPILLTDVNWEQVKKDISQKVAKEKIIV